MPSVDNDLEFENNTVSTMDNTPLLPKLKCLGGSKVMSGTGNPKTSN